MHRSIDHRLGLALLLLLTLCVFTFPAEAQGLMPDLSDFTSPEPVPKPTAPEIGDRMVQMVNVMMIMLKNLWTGGRPALESVGTKILYALITLNMIWVGLRVVGGTTDLVGASAEMIKVMAIASLVYAAISPSNAWSPFIGPNVTLGEFVQDGFFRLSGLSGDSWLTQVLAVSKKTIVSVWDLPIIPEDMSLYEKVKFAIGRLDVMLFVVALKVICTILLVLATVATLGHLLMATVQIGLNLFLAPLLAPWLLFKPMSYLFMGWLKSMVSAGLLLFVGFLFAKGGQAFMAGVGSMVPQSNGLWYGGNEVAAFYVSLTLATALFLFVASKLDRLASAVLTGSTAPGTSLMEMYFAGRGVAGTIKAGASAVSAGVGGAMRAAAGVNAVSAAQQAKNAAATSAGGAAFGSLGGTPPPRTAPLSLGERVNAYRNGTRAFSEARKGNKFLGESYRASSNAGVQSLQRGRDATGGVGAGSPAGAPAAPRGGSRAGGNTK